MPLYGRKPRDGGRINTITNSKAKKGGGAFTESLDNRCPHVRSPVTVAVISSNGEGDQAVESLDVKAPGGWLCQSDPYRGRAT